MGTIVMSGPQNITLDGVVQDPDGKEGWERGGWFAERGGADLGPWADVALEEANAADAWLLGRRSYEFFSTRWEPREGELADRLRAIPKFVVSSTLASPTWSNTTVLDGEIVTAVSSLKESIGGEIVVPASHRLGRTLMAHGLVDEVRLVVFPIVVGRGDRFFDPEGPVTTTRLVEARAIGEGLVMLRYRVG